MKFYWLDIQKLQYLSRMVFPFQYDEEWLGANFFEFCEFKIWKYLSTILDFWSTTLLDSKILDPYIDFGPGGSPSLDWESKFWQANNMWTRT